MHSTWISRLILAVALTVMPLQALAETIASLLCMPQSHARMLRADHAHQRDAGGMHAHQRDAGGMHAQPADHVGSSDESTPSAFEHSCCNVVVLSALPTGNASLQIPQFAAVASTPQVSRYHAFLERPKRPPLV